MVLAFGSILSAYSVKVRPVIDLTSQFECVDSCLIEIIFFIIAPMQATTTPAIVEEQQSTHTHNITVIVDYDAIVIVVCHQLRPFILNDFAR